MNKRLTSGFTLVGLAIATVAWCWDAPSPSHDSQLRSLRMERVETLRTLVDAVGQRHNQGTVSFAEVLDARHQLLKAEAQLAATPAERIEIHQKLVDNLRQLESALASQFAIGNASQSDLLRAKARRLKFAIRLVEVQQANQ